MGTTERGSWGYGTERDERTVLITERNSLPMGGGHRRQLLTFKHPPVKTLDDMTDEERRAIERQYGARIVGQRYKWKVK